MSCVPTYNLQQTNLHLISIHKTNGSLMINKNSEQLCQQRSFNYSASLSKDWLLNAHHK